VQRLVILNTASFPLPAAKRMPLRLRMGRDSKLGGWAIRRFNLFARGAARFGTMRALPPTCARPTAACTRAGRTRSRRCASCKDIPLAPGDKAWPLVEAAGYALPATPTVPPSSAGA
jgi:haloalkane dehalogenase